MRAHMDRTDCDGIQYCVAGTGFVSGAFCGRRAAEEFCSHARGSISDLRVVTAEEGRCLKRAMLERRP
jgi:hypothetical protein